MQRFCTSTDNVILGWLSDIQAKVPVVEWEYTLCVVGETQVKDKHCVFSLERKLCSTMSLFILALVPQKMDSANHRTNGCGSKEFQIKTITAFRGTKELVVSA